MAEFNPAILQVRWYAVDKHGVATPCADLINAIEVATQNTEMCPRRGPWRPVKMAEVDDSAQVVQEGGAA